MIHPFRRSFIPLGLCALAGLFAFLLLHDPTPAQGQAHGDPDATTQSKDIHQPGPAVLAARITQRWSEQGMTQNPVGFSFDANGNLYIVEGWRKSRGAVAIVGGPMRRSNSLDTDLQNTRVEDRAAHIERLIAGGFYRREFFTGYADKVRLLKDTNGDGKADRSTIFADGFNDELDGIASDVLWLDGKVYLTNIPHLWLLEDKDGDGDADETTEGERVSLSYGYGIRWAYGGHDLHGLVRGPDGRIYFSMGDRGYNIQTKEGNNLFGPDRGAVFRMWPDGSGLEIFCDGLRNPQDLAFDVYGNLFTGENNSDGGDLARFCYLPEGSDSGWRQDVQSLNDRGPWNSELMWRPRLGKDDLTQPAWIMHPLANVGRGPSGLAHYPGTGDVYPSNGSFLMCDYPAGVRHVQVKAAGANFKVTQDSSLVGGQTISDAKWGYDGRLYLADWGGGWAVNPNGYIKTITNHTAHQEQAQVIKQVQSLFANGFKQLSDNELIDLLGHQDQRVRLEAQYEAARRKLGIKLTQVLSNTQAAELARLHAMWALGMICRTSMEYAGSITPILEDANPNLRAQAASVLGDIGYTANDLFIALLADKEPTVRHHAAIALGKTGNSDAIVPLLSLLERNDDNDVVIRHAASYALSLIGSAETIHNKAKGRSSARRLGSVLALRRLDSPLLTKYLSDPDPLVAAEAARAIYDKRIMDAMPALAELIETLPADRMSEPVMRRAIEACVRMKDSGAAMRLGRLASNSKAPEQWRLLALAELDNWSAQRNREGVWGKWWPRESQTMDHALAAMRAALPNIIKQTSGKVHTAARLMDLRHIANATPSDFAKIVLDPQQPAELRFAVAERLAKQDKALAKEVTVKVAYADESPVELRQSVRVLLMGLDKQAGIQSFIHAAQTGVVVEQQQAIAQLSRANTPESVALIRELAGDLERGRLTPQLRLDVYAAATANKDIPNDILAFAQAYAKANTLPGQAPFIRDAVMAGGSIEDGKDIFLNQNTAQCQRCHTVDGTGSVGPDLAAIGLMRDAAYLYNALVKPNADIAPGYAISSVTLKNGAVKTGRIVESKTTGTALVLANSDGIEERIAKADIQGTPTTSKLSMMPAMTDKLSPAELRDVLAYLSSLQDDRDSSLNHGKTSHAPIIMNPMKGLKHLYLLPAVLLSVCVGLGGILLVTIFGAKQG